MNLSYFLFVACGFILFGACSNVITGAEGKGTIQSDGDLDVGNKQVLVDTFRNLVRYALLKTNRDGQPCRLRLPHDSQSCLRRRGNISLILPRISKMS